MSRTSIKPETKIFLAMFLIGFAFVACTQRAWEDYWITFRASRNLATGQGLVFTPGERIHTFTSPLGVLLPAGLSWLTGNGPEELVLWLFRIVSLAALAAGVAMLFPILKQLIQRPVAIGVTLVLVALDAKTLDFSTNGMETGLLIFFLSLTLHGFFISGPKQILRIGLGWAGLMWTRPDSCVYIAALGIGALLFLRRGPAGSPAENWLATLSRAGLICAALYLPWFLWTWWYYGTPVPHTVVAKATNLPPIAATALAGNFLSFPFRSLLNAGASIWWTFLPAYSWLQTWYCLPTALFALASWAVALAWLCPLCRPATRMLSFCVYAGHYFLSDVVRSYYPWYLPAVAFLGYLTLGLIFDQSLGLAERLPQLNWDRGWLRHSTAVLHGAAMVFVACQLGLTVCVAREAQVQQRLIEDGVRRPIGLWLRAHAASSHDTVFLEPLGYIGYFSGLKMLDYPGLSSKEMVAVRRRLGPQRENEAYLELKPDWLVLRPDEVTGNKLIDSSRLMEFYDVVAVMDVSDQINAIRWLPGRINLQADQKYLIFHRKAAEKPKPSN
ncbi:MAG TPA: hypothetical protein VN836_08190 [Verrucomicrobiae bacterium]|nr:hypothetical protein [Verrucomicrobiae bacterium]